MTSLTFPDVNVWLALSSVEHVHRDLAQRWWDSTADKIAFCRYTQMGLLRLVTTSAAMKQNPMNLGDAWLLAFAQACGGKLLTFDRALAPRGAECLL